MQDALTQRVQGWAPFFVIVDSVAVALSFWVASIVAQVFPAGSLPHFIPAVKEAVLLPISLMALLAHFIVWLREGYIYKLLSGHSLKVSISQALFVAAGLFVYVALWRDYMVSRKLLLVHLVLLAPALWASKAGFMTILRAMGNRIEPRLRILAVCDEASEASTKQWFANKQMLGIHLCDVLSMERGGHHESFINQRLDEAVGRDRPNLLIWRLPTDAPRTERLRQIAEAHGAHLAVDMLPIVGDKGVLHYSEYAEMRLVSLHRHPLVSPAYRFMKRALDIAFSLPVVLFVLPFLSAGVWLLHRRYSPGPLFFKQTRSGADGRRFQIYKYRTMTVNHGREAVQARANDSRVFKGGALMRKLSIDEMPQFINVLLGDMSVVGPRPHMTEHDVLFAMECSEYAMRHAVKPGVTGLAQVRGFRGPVDDAREIKERVTSDIEYCQNWSLGLDLQIIARTVLHVFSFHSKSC